MFSYIGLNMINEAPLSFSLAVREGEVHQYKDKLLALQHHHKYKSKQLNQFRHLVFVYWQVSPNGEI